MEVKRSWGTVRRDRPTEATSTLPPSDAWLFAQALLGNPVPNYSEQEHLEWVAEITGVREGSWDPAKHPKGGFPQNRGWFSRASGSGPASPGVNDGSAVSPFQTVSFKAPDTAAIWKGAVIAARGRGLPTALLDWNATYRMTIAQGKTPKFRLGTVLGATLELDELNILRLTRIGNAGKFNPATDTTALGNVYNEAFHAWFWGNKASLGWLLKTMNSQKQFGGQILEKAEEAMSETINQIVNDLEANQGVLTYEELLKLKPSDIRRENLTPGHNEPGQRMWYNNAGSEKEMSEELYYATIWVMHNGNKNPAPDGGNQVDALKRFFATKFHPEWNPQQVQEFVKSRSKK